MSAEAYPLYWPEGWKRTSNAERKNAQFSRRETNYRDGHSWSTKKWLTVFDGVKRIQESLERMGVHRNDLIISTNVPTRLDGTPRSDRKEPDDPGAAVYWRNDGNAPMRCMAVDRYTTVADNLAAIAATLEAMRAIERHGGAEILDRTFRGFAALPASTSRAWWEVLGINRDASPGEIDASYRHAARLKHPDAGGSNDAMAELNMARQQALAEVSA